MAARAKELCWFIEQFVPTGAFREAIRAGAAARAGISA
jgi:hypothetical protein